IAERAGGDLDRGDGPLATNVRDMTDRGPASGPQVQHGSGGMEAPNAAPGSQIGRELASIRIPSTVLHTAFAGEALPVHGHPGNQVPGQEPRAIGVDALPFRRPDVHPIDRWYGLY